MRTKGEAAKAAGLAVMEYRHQKANFEAEMQAAQAALTEVEAEYVSTLREMAEGILPSAEPELVQRISQASGVDLVPLRPTWQGKLSALSSRLQTIEADPEWQAREQLLDPVNGELNRKLNLANERHGEAIAMLEPFRNDDFEWVIHREEEKNAGISGFKTFLRAITFAETREGIVRRRLVKKLAFESWEELTSTYYRRSDECQQAMEEASGLQQRRQRLDDLVEEQLDLWQWVHNFEARLTQELQMTLATQYSGKDPMRLRHLSGRYRVLISKLHALEAKMKYLQQIIGYTSREAADRHTRAMKIERVQRLWERKPWDRLAGDKTKWLVTVPAMKKKSTEKRTRWLKKMRIGIADYDDYDDYDYYYESYQDRDDYMLPYDAFAYSADERMPYEGFSSEVISDIGTHRQECDLEKADYSFFKGLDKEERPDLDIDDSEAEVEIDDVDVGEAAAAAFVAEAAMEGFADAS